MLLALGTAVVLLEVHQASHLKTIVEEPKAAADDCLGDLAFLVTINRVGKGKARTPIAVIRNVILRLPAQSAGQSEERVGLPVVLEKKAASNTFAKIFLTARRIVQPIWSACSWSGACSGNLSYGFSLRESV